MSDTPSAGAVSRSWGGVLLTTSEKRA